MIQVVSNSRLEKTKSSGIQRTTEKLTQAAETVASNASDILGRTTWAGTEAQLNSTIAGSERAEPLTSEKRNRIHRWSPPITSQTIKEGHETATTSQASVFSDIIDVQTRATSSGPTDDTSAAKYQALGDMSDSDDDFEAELIRSQLEEANDQIQNHTDYIQAELNLRGALEALGESTFRARENFHEQDMKYDLAIACYKQDKLGEAQSLCEEIRGAAASSEEDRL